MDWLSENWWMVLLLVALIGGGAGAAGSRRGPKDDAKDSQDRGGRDG